MKGNLLCILILCSLAPGCCTIMNTPTQTIPVKSYPSGAKVLVNGELKGTTPVAIKLKRKENHAIEIQLEGHQLYRVTTTRNPSFWVLGDLVFTLPMVAIDAMVGSVYTVEPSSIHVDLTKSGAGASDEQGK